ncbi:MAG TPA: type I-C CRISPR-associated protein Cas8c/Csd1 [Caulobacteraceae bacterium]|nr:type I-C CRISPR-associated protein Cas8c/Csd1 [Caulobacteraceae bacterium]
MSVLEALDHYYDRMAKRGEAEQPGYSREKISFAIVLNRDGIVSDITDLREPRGKALRPRLLEVPKAVTRTSGVSANLFWDKTAYVLGRTAGDGKRTEQEHQAFKDRSLELIGDCEDDGLVALKSFLQRWRPEDFNRPPFTPDMADTNIVFRLAGENRYLHEREAARTLVKGLPPPDGPIGFCLVTGREARLARLHPAIRGVQGAQSSGAALVSFNLDAFTSYGAEQGANAPTSEEAGFRYGAALNRMLDPDSRNRLPRPIGDATVVFWADTSDTVDEDAAQAAEEDFLSWFETPAGVDHDQDPAEGAKLMDALKAVAAGRPQEVDPRLRRGTRFHVLGLAPNAARLSIRYWLDDDFAALAGRLRDHLNDLRIEPTPRGMRRPPAVRWLLVRTTALRGEFDNVPPLLAGEVMRSILTGGPYPRALLAGVIMRLRARDDPTSGWHAAVIRAVLAREHRLGFTTEEPPMSLNRESPDPAYQLGRLFAVLEATQRSALGKVNATIRDRYMGAASAAPAGMFPLLMRNAQEHLGKLRRTGKGGWLEREIEEIENRFGDGGYPRSLRLDDQGRFFLGYYHQRSAQFAGRPTSEIDEDEETPDDN